MVSELGDSYSFELRTMNSIALMAGVSGGTDSEVASETSIPTSLTAPTTLHSDNSFSGAITAYKLNGRNFVPWSRSVQMVIRGKRKFGYLDGSIPSPPVEDPSFASWDIQNSLVMSWLIHSMENRIGELYLMYGTASAIWDAVKRAYSDLEDSSQMFALRTRARDLRQANGCVSDYYHSLTRVWQELDLFQPQDWKDPADARLHRRILEKERTYDFLAGLNPSLDEVRGRILGVKPLPSLDEIFAEVRREEHRKSVMLGPNVSSPVDSSAMAARASDEKGKKPTTWCDHCHKPYHTKSKCWKLHGKPADWVPKHMRDNSGHTTSAQAAIAPPPPALFTDAQLDQLSKIFSSAHTASFMASTGKPLNSISDPSKAPWLIDSGASDHMTAFYPINQLQGGIVSGANLWENAVTDHDNFWDSNHPPTVDWEFLLTDTPDPSISPPNITQIPPNQTPEISKKLPPNPISTTKIQPYDRCYERRKNLQQIEEPGTSHDQAQLPVPGKDLTLSEIDIPIALRKGKRACTNHPISDFLSYAHLSQAMQKPQDKKSVGCKWVFTIKYNSDGTIERHKARLVAKGYTQTQGIDFQETFAPVAKINSIRILLSLAVNLDWPLLQLDVKNAFLNGELEEEVYMDLPPGFNTNHNQGNSCRLKKSLYGLKQSPRAWFGRFMKFVQRQGFKQAQVDHTLFYKRQSTGITILIVYVDDIVLTGDDKFEMQRIKAELAREFDMKDLGNLRFFLGMEIARNKDSISVSQRKYTLDLLKETGMLGSKPADTPMDANLKLVINSDDKQVDKGSYQRLVGKLIHLSHTRPDIGFAVSCVSQFMHSPSETHMRALYRILRYLKGNPGRGLLFRRSKSRDIQMFVDADYAGSPIDRRSTSGYCSFVWGNLVTWRSKKQNVVARSSAEAELRSVALGTCEGLWIKMFLKELELEALGPIREFCDNNAAISIIHNPVHHDKIKHVEVDRHFIKEKIDQGILAVKHIPTEEQTTDILTKALFKPTFQKFVTKLGMYNLYSPA
ncbi:uncharacterized protein LOC142537165 [Primulina tabacum]|uniref:uncharacterized protein LOC142537165 n=1 Tax=Primulina tabacum TaxID=48773 RepID=UPI003F598682